MTMTPMLDTDTGAATWAGVPELATCSYGRYRRSMGTAVRITRHALRGVPLPNPAYTDRPHWPTVRTLFPSAEIFHKGLSGAVFQARYLAALDTRPREIENDLRAVTLDEGTADRLVLLCFELNPEPLVCHRTMFARWWTARTGQDVPELELA
jgi:hypothetical protein